MYMKVAMKRRAGGDRAESRGRNDGLAIAED
jgi:hypothetical protein